MLYDFHTHSSLSDGTLSPMELISRAFYQDYSALGITDHVGLGYLDRLIDEISKDCALAAAHWNMTLIPGVELTHLPAKAIPAAAKQAKEKGAKLVVVHGETITEPQVETGTNLEAVKSPHVDILAHPGLLTIEEAKLAANNGVFIEISGRKGHSFTNGHVARVAKLAGAKLIVNSDAHDGKDLLTSEFAQKIAQGAGLEQDELLTILTANPLALLEKLNLRI